MTRVTPVPAASIAAVVGADVVGLELAENLRHRGLTVTVVQRGGHV